ncbi:rhamnogalacturonan acetylesterase [Hymenobacter sp. BT770]|uniref:rhamnogalacturonan acetylesterase n=1 Tax=Hymenobacter sp. BT770 TaxID=2886942 RepID=UPI001D0F93B9|nr:rhamnogalacturonan acetylesterase [Hymenobacter sp. BT770]MCC3154963.1 rhamnogalacturonan acetylesterase [Hymenobacter sp. BT770]MDO3416859.1 rhamnogalacturonan acetylesterase [Hymenobacter sp. BT770]
MKSNDKPGSQLNNPFGRTVLGYGLLLVCLLSSAFTLLPQKGRKPTLFLIGDSTVKNGKGKGDGGLWGWGNYLPAHFDTTRIRIENDALGGTSSRTFQTKGLWAAVQAKIQPGDFVIMQFGHNDDGPLADTARARGTIKSNGEESQEVYNPLTNQQEVVHSYGWYLRKLIADTKAKGATPVVCSLIPRNGWKEGKVNRATDGYTKWAAEAARQGGAYFIDLNKLVADKYDREGEAKVGTVYFTSKDHTHTIEAGAQLNAATVAEGIRATKGLALRKYLKKI